MSIYEIRVRTERPEVEQMAGRILTEDDYNVLLTKDTLVRKPTGQVLLIYRRGIVPDDLRETAYPILHSMRGTLTSNRGMAGGSKRVATASGKRSEARRVSSVILGAFDPQGPRRYCRLTHWTGKETERWRELWPLLQFIGQRMRADAPDRWRAQMEYVSRTHPYWTIPGTPFSTVTVNNTYATGVHTDKGDLDEGISTLVCFRRGQYTGGILCFPKFRVAVDMQDGDLVLMDAHEWHGNTRIVCACGVEPTRGKWPGPCAECGAERISVVSYYRTRVATCRDPETEEEAQRIYAEQKNMALIGE